MNDKDKTMTAGALLGGDAEPGVSWRLLPIVVFCALAIVGYDISDGTPYLADIDDRLRALQIRQLLSSGRWFDLTLPMIRMPEAYVSPWSRLVDLPYAAISLVLSRLMDMATAIRWSFLIWPPTMLLVYCILVLRIVRDLTHQRLSSDWIVLITTTLFMALAICEFTPERIDHHNMQIVLLLAIFAGTLGWSCRGGAAVGVATGLSLAIGLECMPIIVVLLAGIVLAWICNTAGAVAMLRSSMIATALSTPVIALALIGPAGFVSTQCDAFSAPYIYLASLLAAAAAIATFVCPPGATPAKRLAALLAPAVIIAFGFLWLFPGCVGGPYGIIDPVSRQMWFERLRQEQSAFDYVGDGASAPIILLAAEALTLLLALPQILRQLRAGRPSEAIVFATSLTSLLLALMRTRFMEFPAVLVPLFLPTLFQGLVADLQLPSKRRAVLAWNVVVTLSVVAVAAVAIRATPSASGGLDMVDSLNANDCTGDLSGLTSSAPVIVMAPPMLGLTMAEQGRPDLSVSAIAFHRASPGMHRTYLAFTTADPAIRREMMARYDYVAVCRDRLPANGVAPLYATLASGGNWPGLLPVGDTAPQTRLRLFRIDHDRLQ